MRCKLSARSACPQYTYTLSSPLPLTLTRAAASHCVHSFTLSKLTGHASTRIGWAIVTDAHVASRMQAFVDVLGGKPRENQLRAIAALQHVNAHRGEIFSVARALMLNRWRRLEAIFANQTATVGEAEGSSRRRRLDDAEGNVSSADGGAGGAAATDAGTAGGVSASTPLFSLEPRCPAGPDSFTGEESYEASPAYAWVELKSTARYGGDAMAAMASVGIHGRSGEKFGSPVRYVRLQLLMRQQTFDILCEKLQVLLRGELAYSD